MSALFEYLDWRGDLDFRTVHPNAVDMLIFSALAYLNFDDIVPAEANGSVPLTEAAQRLLSMEDAQERCRVKKDLTLLEKAAQTLRFGSCRIGCYRNVLVPEEEIQFASVTFLLSDGSAVVTYRGTDYTLTGWKEDFNMSFQDAVPAQLAALEYLHDFADASTQPLHLCGHSKGGNLAAYAAAKAEPVIQRRIVGVHNNDGPGFREAMMEDPGYQAILPRLYTYVPQSSVFGMMLEHEEPFQVVKSKQVGGLLQHDPYSWEVMGGDFIRMEETTDNARLLDTTLKAWMSEMTVEERNTLVDAVFDLLGSGGAEDARELMKPQALKTVLRNLKGDEGKRKLLSGEFGRFALTALRNQLSKVDFQNED